MFPALGALTYGTVHIFRKLGTELVAEPTVGAAVNLTTSFLLVTGGLAVTGRLGEMYALIGTVAVVAGVMVPTMST